VSGPYDDVLSVQDAVIACERCPELRKYAQTIAAEKKRAYREWTYWAKPVPAFGDTAGRVVLVGLAPGAHGSNRTGRMFTGDASGVWLYRALFKAGFSNQPTQSSKDDGLVLHDVFITAAIRCAPPGNKPTPEQIRKCAPYITEELRCLPRMRVVVGLGAIGAHCAFGTLSTLGYHMEKRFTFAHGNEIRGTQSGTNRSVTLLMSYHPSRQNTNTGVLTEPMFDAIFARARAIASAYCPQ
jgi:uracil-DNA glycosylase